MSKGKVLRDHIANIKSTKHITNAMKMAAAAKLKKTHRMVQASRPYTQKLEDVIHHLLASADEPLDLPLMKVRPVKHYGIILITDNIGLAGGFSSNLAQFAEKGYYRQEAKGRSAEIITVGLKGYDYLKNRPVSLYPVNFQISDVPTVHEAENIMDEITKAYMEGRFDKVVVVYQSFISAGRQEPAIKTLLPVVFGTLEDRLKENYIYEPDKQSILERLLPHYLCSQMFQAMIETKASEFAARVMTMTMATDNANSMINKLLISYNRWRQTVITNEITEIVNGANAIE